MKATMLALFCVTSACVRATALLPCPDCGATVSPRAFMCPKCGCRGEVIADEAKRLAEKPKPKEPDRVVVANLGSRTYEALPVVMDGGRFIVMPLEQVLDLETLVFSFVSTNTTIGYSVPEVALDQPLIRFPITETNLLFAAATTNVASELAADGSVMPSAASGWQSIQPKVLKNHGKILLRIKAGEDAKLPPKAHPYYKHLADLWSDKEKQQ